MANYQKNNNSALSLKRKMLQQLLIDYVNLIGRLQQKQKRKQKRRREKKRKAEDEIDEDEACENEPCENESTVPPVKKSKNKFVADDKKKKKNKCESSIAASPETTNGSVSHENGVDTNCSKITNNIEKQETAQDEMIDTPKVKSKKRKKPDSNSLCPEAVTDSLENGILFEGGFSDGETDIGDSTAVSMVTGNMGASTVLNTSKSPNKKKKRKNVDTSLSSPVSSVSPTLNSSPDKKKRKSVNTSLESSPVSSVSPSLNSSPDSDIVKVKKKKLKNKKKISLDSDEAASGNDSFAEDSTALQCNGSESESSVSPKKKKSPKGGWKVTDSLDTSLPSPNASLIEDAGSTPGRKLKKKKMKSSPSPLKADVPKEGEVDVFIPNKKYNGPDKEAFTKQADLSKTDTGSLFATFEKVKMPNALVKRAILKATPKTDPKGKKKNKLPVSDSLSDPGKKRVKICLKNNIAQDFAESLNVSPVVPFDPFVKPENGILKPSPFRSPVKKLNFKKRAKAADFF